MSDRTESLSSRQARNPFSNDIELAGRPIGALANAEQQRSIAEVQARMIIARSNPRDPMRCMEAILRDCTRPSAAKDAVYQYARGGSSVSGPSIRLAEAIARRWGNIASGIKEISRSGGYSECVAYAWDLETGYYDERQFQVKHWRDTKSGGYAITDERDIYELVANMGQRRKRAVLLTVIPGDVVEAAVDQCEETLMADADTSPEALKRLVDAFAAFHVYQTQIEKRCQCRLAAIRPAQIVQLRKIYASLKDEMSIAADWFEPLDADDRKPAPPKAQTDVAKTPGPGQKALAQRLKESPPSDVGGGSSPPADKPRVAPSVSDAGSEHPHSEQGGATSLAAKPRVGPSAPASDSGQTNQPPPPDEEPPFPGDTIEAPEIWPYDEFGEMPDGMSEPMSERQFADWFAAALFKSPNPDALIEHNGDNIGATVRNAEAAGIVQAALDRHRKRKADSSTPPNQSNEPAPALAAPPPAEKPKRKPIALGKTPKGSPHWPNYGDAAKAEISALMSEADIDDWIATNKPTYAGGAVEIAIDNRISKRREFLRPVAAATDPNLVLEGIHSTMLTVTSIEQIIEWSKKPETAAMWAALKAAGADFYAKGVEILDNRRVQLE